jgi:cytochrome c oxidase subunit 1
MTTLNPDVTQTDAPPSGGLWSWITTTDHKKIGILYGGSAIVFFVVGGIEALLIRVQLATPNGEFLSADAYNQMFTMHATTMVFLVVMPAAAAFTNYFLPILLGARDVAFPRLNALSYWVFFFGGLFLTVSFFLGGAPDGGWFGYAPLSTQVTEVVRMDYWALGLQIVGLASLLASVNFITTVFAMRAPGMTLMRCPSSRSVSSRCSSTAIWGPCSSMRPTGAIRFCGSTCSGCSAIPRCTS